MRGSEGGRKDDGKERKKETESQRDENSLSRTYS